MRSSDRPTAPRPVGRQTGVSPGDPAASDAILEAAEELFAAKGFERTTIKDIGEAAGVNTALIYYYFENKVGLYRTVLTRIGLGIRQEAEPAMRQAKTVEDVVRAIVRAQARMLSRPRFATLLHRELIDHGAAHAHQMMQQLAAGLFRPACEAIEQGKKNGTIRADLDTRFAAISTISQLVYFTLAKPAVRILLAKDDDYPTPEDVEAFGRHAAEFAIAAMGAAPSPRKKARR